MQLDIAVRDISQLNPRALAKRFNRMDFLSGRRYDFHASAHP